MYLSTLPDFVKAMGGELKLVVNFQKEPSRSVSLRNKESSPWPGLKRAAPYFDPM
jgi:hypothetical protein